MIRYAEAVLDGHPDRFCDLLADAILYRAYCMDPGIYGQVEVSVWSDIITFTGSIVSSENDAVVDLRDVVDYIGRKIGYSRDNHIDVEKYNIADHLCQIQDDPLKWTSNSNDQSIVVGYAGYDELTRYLPPEQFLAHFIRHQLTGMLGDRLKPHGPDGKVLVLIKESDCGSMWHIEKVLCTMQQHESAGFFDFTLLLATAIKDILDMVCRHDLRWVSNKTEILVNPNGPLLNGGSDGDNGQTGRKLVMDFYGPRIPIGGGALHGKDFTNIDRSANLMAREYAIKYLQSSLDIECTVEACYAPNMKEPLHVKINGKTLDDRHAMVFREPVIAQNYSGILNWKPVRFGTSEMHLTREETSDHLSSILSVEDLAELEKALNEE